MKNIYETPKFEIINLENLDVITESSIVVEDIDWNFEGWMNP